MPVIVFGLMFSLILWANGYTGADATFSGATYGTPGSGTFLFMLFGQLAWVVTAPIAIIRLKMGWKLYKTVNEEWQNCRCETVYAGLSPGR